MEARFRKGDLVTRVGITPPQTGEYMKASAGFHLVLFTMVDPYTFRVSVQVWKLKDEDIVHA